MFILSIILKPYSNNTTKFGSSLNLLESDDYL